MSKFKIQNSKFHSGFTLLELVIYLAIVSSAVVSFVYFIISISNSGTKTNVAQEVHANGRTALDVISQRIRASNGVNIGASTFGTDPPLPGVLSLDFSVVGVSKNPTIINLTADDGKLQITEGTPPVVTAITSDKVKITKLEFTNATAAGARENIRVNLTIEYNNTSGSKAYTYSKSFTTAVSVRQ